MMEIDEVILSKLIKTKDVKYTLYLDNNKYPLANVSIIKSSIPVRKPTTRGGVYFSDTMAYKIKATTNDLSIIPLLPKIMLGPNTDFKPIKIKTTLHDEKLHTVILITHITNTMNSSTILELNLIIDKTNFE